MKVAGATVAWLVGPEAELVSVDFYSKPLFSDSSFVTNEDGGTFRNHARFDNRGSAELDNIGLFETTGDLDNACDFELRSRRLDRRIRELGRFGHEPRHLEPWPHAARV